MEEGLQVNHRDVLLPFDFLSLKEVTMKKFTEKEIWEMEGTFEDPEVRILFEEAAKLRRIKEAARRAAKKEKKAS